MTQPILKTKRLLLRGFYLDDADDIQHLAGNINVSKQTVNIPHPYEAGMAQAWIETHQENWNSKGRITCAVVNLTSNQLLGTVGFVRNDRDTAELGYWFGEPFWGMGYCTEAVCELIRFAFDDLNLNVVIARHLTSNPASGQVMIKAGMRYVSTTYQPGRNKEIVSLKLYEIRK